MTGWTVAAEPKKNLSFSEHFVALGVCFDFKCALEGQIVISNRAERIADMRVEIDSIVEAGRISSKQAAQIRGKLLFAEAQSFGRWSRFHRSALDSHANGVGSGVLTPELQEELL
eukprot:5864761-Amphidinium_carterae.1